MANRVQRLQDFARSQDLVLFVGGAKSSNAKVLYRHCLEANPNSYFVSSAEELSDELINKCRAAERIGICGATSTPLWLMEQIHDMLTANS